MKPTKKMKNLFGELWWEEGQYPYHNTRTDYALYVLSGVIGAGSAIFLAFALTWGWI